MKQSTHKIIDKREIKSVLLDLDGTLTYFEPTDKYAVGKVYDKLGLPYSDDIYKWYLTKEMEYWENVQGRATLDDLQGYHRIDFVRSKLYQIIFPELDLSIHDGYELMNIYIDNLGVVNEVIPDAQEIVKYLYDNYKLYIVSNGPGSSQRRKLEKTDMIQYFEGIVTTDDALCEKPTKEFFEYLFKEHGVNPDDSILIGDSLTSDILGANNSNIKSIWFNRNNINNTTDINPTIEINKLRELKRIL